MKLVCTRNKKDNLLLYSDRKAFGLIIYNLLDNALKYTEFGKEELTVLFKSNNPGYLINEVLVPELNGKDEELKIVVYDTGTGIKKEDQQYIFDTFKKFEHSKNKIFRDISLGLALVKNLTEKLFADIDLQSEVNVGTKVSISIPLSYKK